MNAIEIKNVSKHYDQFSLNHINLVVPQGYIVGLIGENGAGKSTLIRLILEIVKKEEGTISVLGKEGMDALTKDDIGVVLDEIGLPIQLNLKQIETILKDIYTRWDSSTFQSYVKKFGIPEKTNFGAMSRGTKMKLAIAIALSHDPKLLILDEATNGLDPIVRDEVVTILAEFTRDESHSILISSHIVSDLEKLCDYIAFLHQGNLILCEEKDVLANEYVLVQCSKEEAESIDGESVIYHEASSYVEKFIMKKDQLPDGMDGQPVRIEDLFVFMVKGMNDNESTIA